MKVLKVNYRFLKEGKMNNNSDARWEHASEVMFERRLKSLRESEDVDIIDVLDATLEDKENLAAMLDSIRGTEVDDGFYTREEHDWGKENLPEYD